MRGTARRRIHGGGSEPASAATGGMVANVTITNTSAGSINEQTLRADEVHRQRIELCDR
jgi:hypothetical protein